jgi:hypothetical protein
MGLKGAQDFWVTGSRFYFLRDPVNGVNQFPIDLGRIEVVNPALAPTKATLKDSDGGNLRIVDEELIEMSETAKITCSNFNYNNQALIFSALPPSSWSQAAGATTNVAAHYGYTGRLLKIHDGAGNPLFHLASVESVKKVSDSSAVTFTVVDLERGFIRITGTVTDATELKVDYTLAAVAADYRLIVPQTGSAIKGTGWTFYGRANNTRQSVREAYVSITPDSTNFADQDFSNFVLNATVISDVTNATNPAGRMLNFLGTPPSLS